METLVHVVMPVLFAGLVVMQLLTGKIYGRRWNVVATMHDDPKEFWVTIIVEGVAFCVAWALFSFMARISEI